MNDEEFLKEHPSLKDKKFECTLERWNEDNSVSINLKSIYSVIHETQIDKQILTQVLLENCEPNQYKKIKNELKL